MVRRRQDAGAAGDRGGARRQDRVRAAAVGSDLFQLDGQYPALVYLAPNLVGPSDPGVVRAGREDASSPRADSEAVAEALAHYAETEEITPRRATTWRSIRRAAAACIMHRDEDVLDTWFSSALWPFSTLGWPDQTPELKRYYPTTTLVTGFDIIFFWVARMMMMGLHFMKEVPFHDRLHPRAGPRRDAAPRCRSRRATSSIRSELIDEYGADALRFTLAALAAQGRDIKLVDAARRGLPQFRDQAVERLPLRRDQRLRDAIRASIRIDVEEDAQPLDRPRDARSRARGDRRRSRPTGSTRRRARSTGSSGMSIATGISN